MFTMHIQAGLVVSYNRENSVSHRLQVRISGLRAVTGFFGV